MMKPNVHKDEMDNLIVKTILGFMFLMLILGLALFLSAGSLNFWQAWVYLAVFAACTILITLYLIKKRSRVIGWPCLGRANC